MDEKEKNDEKEKRAPRRSKLPGRFAGVLGILALIIGSIFLCGFLPVFLGSIFLDGAWFVPGSASSFDPIANFDAIAGHAGKDYQLTYFNARYVKPDGTLDLYANYEPSVSYQFSKEIEPPGGRKPIGVGSAPEGQYFETVIVNVENDTWPFTMDRHVIQSSNAEEKTLLPAPICSFATLWAAALEEGAPTNAVATIYYTEDGYNFSIDGTSTYLRFNNDCKLIQ